jgi:predicted transcriptional regulator
MKTTIELPDQLLRRAKALAASEGRSLKQLLSEALEERLRASEAALDGPAWKRLAGGLASLRAETDRITRRIEEEFERIDPEDDP